MIIYDFVVVDSFLPGVHDVYTNETKMISVREGDSLNLKTDVTEI